MNFWDSLDSTDKARQLLPKLSPVARRALLYLAGDYWQLGEGWGGTRIPPDIKNRAEKEAELLRTFTPQPMIEECVERFVGGLLSHEPATGFVLSRPLEEEEKPTPEEQIALDEANAALSTFWDKRGVQELAQDFTRHLCATGRASMRFFVPRGALDETGDGLRLKTKGGTGATWLDALDSIYFEVPSPEQASVVIDPQTMVPVSVFVYSDTKPDPAYQTAQTLSGKPGTTDGLSGENGVVAGYETDALSSFNNSLMPGAGGAWGGGGLGGSIAVKRVEISYVNDEGQTVIRILEEGGSAPVGEATQDTGGELYLAQATMPPLVTDAVQRLQNALNVINTMLLHNGNLAGFRERNYVNLQRPRRQIADASVPGGFRYEDDSVVVGPGAANYHTGIVYKDENGAEKIATGSIVITDPVDPAPLIAAKEQFETAIYKAVDQLHVLINGDGAASGVARIQARASFILRLQKARPKLESVLRSRIRGAFILAAFLAGDEERTRLFSEFRVRVDCHISAGPLAPEERLSIVSEYEKGVISLETAQILLGIEDATAEKQKMESESAMSLQTLQNRALATQTLALAGAGIEAAALVAGFSEEQAKLLGQTDFAGGEPDVPDVPVTEPVTQ